MKVYAVFRHRFVHGFDRPTLMSEHHFKEDADDAIQQNMADDERHDRQGYWYTIEYREKGKDFMYFYDPTRKS